MPFGNGTSSQQQILYEYSKKKKLTCDECNKNEKIADFTQQSPSYYRNKSSANYYFCSNECSITFKKTKLCGGCHYNSNLKYYEKNNCVYCTDYPFEISCYQKHQGDYICNYCNEEKNAYNNSKCYVIAYDELVCSECAIPYNHIFNEYITELNKRNKFRSQKPYYEDAFVFIDSDTEDKFREQYDKNETYNFICNNCNEIKNIFSDKITIDEETNRNLCSKCSNDE